jgi:hypothetical protein
MGKFKNKDGLHKLKGLTTQSDKKQYISGDQNPLKKTGRDRKAKRVGKLILKGETNGKNNQSKQWKN